MSIKIDKNCKNQAKESLSKNENIRINFLLDIEFLKTNMWFLNCRGKIELEIFNIARKN